MQLLHCHYVHLHIRHETMQPQQHQWQSDQFNLAMCSTPTSQNKLLDMRYLNHLQSHYRYNAEELAATATSVKKTLRTFDICPFKAQYYKEIWKRQPLFSPHVLIRLVKKSNSNSGHVFFLFPFWCLHCAYISCRKKRSVNR